MKSLIITDSRGTGISHIIAKNIETDNVTVSVHRGAGLQQAARRALPTFRTLNPEIVIIMAGICNITEKNKRTSEIHLRHRTVTDTVIAVMDSVRAAHNIIREQDQKCTVSIATIPGLDLSDYNNKRRKYMTDEEYRKYCKTSKTPHPDQETLNEAILEINRRITRYNENNRIPTTWIAGIIHPIYRRKHHHHYARLQDGCHGTTKTRIHWAKQITRTIAKAQKGDTGDP